MSVVNVARGQVEISATSRSLVQRSPTDCLYVCVCVCVRVFEREREREREATITLYTYIEQAESDQPKKKISPF